ncbi:MAG: nickel pincer cofactor biosynthesis protein LarB [Gemmatimonadetes bacterium]|uniref:Nickel pincer cofactor biosynthesis protein LarB n=1 Tax=Candidatus Kutchimonas denitrificans TaxID=3056748 RepID=A0AAE4ZBA6_9BACT|nr:nickel pincer cofactor biosynthesis protein LarB [Gemmatimonadota bacterium]NIR75711.1 nickel pincer cofactor biosynthesis protein LarB [Candidatus Kutchimonas denitrificans]NIS00324.1 nickel pincer cofactor biosynthesis protein LarB [Gemmatimonadota bacterium]NIT65983.1 nickel pincer cofactor biosynthesis protein LarB [Gemmatimonadota bacterium]NIU53687.1 nickel pincer cofactor biosynthesis protein LarB [Gemmatimonadota bacterium]
MRPERLKSLLERLQRGELSVTAALAELERLPFEDLGFARVDHHRALRQGYPEVVYCPGKTPDQISKICARLAAAGDGLLVTRADAPIRERLAAEHPTIEVNELARTAYLPPAEPLDVHVRGPVLVVTAGTSDLAVAEEAAVAARAMGNPVRRLDDVGVAGIHRLFAGRQELDEAAVLIVVAGMEAALASVIGGLIAAPVIAVPTSIGYGASFGGLAALLGLLNSCAPGVTVVNIDNGYGAAAAAARINRLR